MLKMFRNKKGQGLVEYGLIIAGVALISAAAISIFGHKTSDLIAAVAAVLPGAHEDNGPIVSGALLETTVPTADAGATLDVATISGIVGEQRLGNNVLGLAGEPGDGFGGLVLEAGEE